jgi:P27 family predicted phage terminase small subunit
MTVIPHAPQRLKPPGDLSDAEKEVFVALVGGVDQQNFRPSDRPLLVEYCTAVVQAREAASHLRKQGPVLGGRVSPWLITQEKSVRAMLMLATRLRLSPQSRARVKLKPVPPLSYYDEMKLKRSEGEDDAAH